VTGRGQPVLRVRFYRTSTGALAGALQKAMKAQKVTPAEMARRMGTSRPTVYRLLDPAERGATLDTLERASLALGLELEIRLVPGARTKGRRQPGRRRAA
jgi:hypothetical protein